MSNKSVLVTGGVGFIGSNFLNYVVKKYPETNFVCLDSVTYAGDVNNLSEINKANNFTFVHGDICDRDLVERIFHHYYIHDVIHFAAESHVDNSISNPGVFIETNVKGTFTLLDVAYKKWMKKPFESSSGFEKSRFLHVSTDEVYGSLGETGLFTENSPYAPNSPYSASKASSDFIVRSYFHTYGLNTIITNCSNNYGPFQHDEKLIPTVIRKAINNENIPIYGDGKNIRDWLYVLDHCVGIEKAFDNGKAGEVYNIGGKNERNNNYIATKICEILDNLKPIEGKSYKSFITYVEDRAGHDFRYAIDATKIETELGWEAKENFESGILKTVQWYLNKYNNKN